MDDKATMSVQNSQLVANTKPWFWVRDAGGHQSVSVTLLVVSFVATTLAYVLSIFQKLGPRSVDISGNPLFLLAGVLVVTTIQFILMGLLAELLVRTYHESQNRPTYVIREILERPQTDGDQP